MSENNNNDISRLLEMPQWEGVLDALLTCDPNHADLLEALIRNLKPAESVYDAQSNWLAEYESMMAEMNDIM